MEMAYVVEKGWTTNQTIDPETQDVDMLGALLLVMDANMDELWAGSPIEMILECVPAPAMARTFAAWEILCAYFKPDPISWNDAQGSSVAVATHLRSLANAVSYADLMVRLSLDS